MAYTGQRVTTFKERLSDLCDSLPMNDAEIALILGVPKQTLSAWKLGTRFPKDITVVGIANSLNVSVEWLMGFDVEKEKPAEASDRLDADLIKKLKQLTPAQRQMVVGFLEGLTASHKV